MSKMEEFREELREACDLKKIQARAHEELVEEYFKDEVEKEKVRILNRRKRFFPWRLRLVNLDREEEKRGLLRC